MQPAQRTIAVRACKYDGRLHRSWQAEFVRQDGSLIILDGRFEHTVDHELVGTIAGGTNSLEHFWLDRWYSIFRFSGPNGQLQSYYCNVNVPPEFDGHTLRYVDLDLDLLVAPDLSYRILDLEEFERNTLLLRYPPTVEQHARRALAELVYLISARKFPFDGATEKS